MSEPETPPNPVDIVEKVVKLPSLEDADALIISNAVFQGIGAFAMLAIYFICRRRAPWVYYPNIKNKPQHPCYQEHPGFFSWIGPLFTVKDTQLLSMIGLDAFMFLQTIKLLYRICFVFSILIVPILCGWFYQMKNAQERAQLFVSMSIWNVKNPVVFWLVVVYAYVATLIIFYLVFIYYKRFVTLRQMYLASPASMTSISQLKKIAGELDGDQNAIDFINVSSRTVLIDRLPSEIKNDEDLRRYLDSLRIGEIESVALVHNTYTLQKLYEERNGIIQDIEKEVALSMIKIKNHYASDQNTCKDSFGDLYTANLEESAMRIFSQSTFKSAEKVALFNEFSEHGSQFISKTWLLQNSIKFHTSKLQEVNRRIIEEKERIQNRNQAEAIDMPVANEELFVETDVQSDVSFFSLQQISHFRENTDFFTLDLPYNKRKAFVTFKDHRTAGIVQQARLGSRAFSSNVLPAPAPNDVIWKTIGKNEVHGFLFKAVSVALYALFIFAFLYLVVMIIQSLGIQQNEQNYVFRLLLEYKPVATVYESILVPLVYNILLYFVPIIIKALIHMEDIYSFSDVQVRLMYRFSLFLFFNAFIATFVTSCVVQFSVSSAMTLPEILTEFKSSVIKASVFFFNTIVQRMCIGMGIVFLKPSPFLYNFVAARWLIYTRRQSMEREFVPPIDFGNHIPNLLLILPMALVYSCICPMMLVISWAFYVVNYVVYKNEMLYATRNDFESGGAFWRPTVQYIFYSVITFQVVTGLLTYSIGMEMIALAYCPLVFFTFVLSEGLNMIFERSSENFPLNAPEEKFLDKFSRKTLQERYKLLSEWKEVGLEADEDVLSISEFGMYDKTSEKHESFYQDPSLMMSIGDVILPENFFKIVHYLRSFDQNNVFGFKK